MIIAAQRAQANATRGDDIRREREIERERERERERDIER